MALVPQEVKDKSLGTFWRGADNNVWVAGQDGTNKAGTWQPGTQDYWQNSGYTQTSDPTTPIFPGTAPLPIDSYNGLGGTGTGSDSSNIEDIQYLDQQQGLYERLLRDSDSFYNSGKTDLEDSYTSGVNKANTQRGRALKDFSDQREFSNIDKNKAIGSVNTNARTLADSLKRILGLASGSDSSAYQFAAPSAVARTASQERSGVVDTFGRNDYAIGRGEKQAKEDFASLLEDLLTQKTKNLQDLDTGIATQKQSINDSLSSIAAERANLSGGNPLSATAPYRTEYNRLQDQIVGNPSKFRTAVTAKPVTVSPAQLSDYTVDRQSINANRSAGKSVYSPYGQFLKSKEEEQV